MNPQTQKFVGLAIGAGTLAYFGVRKPWKQTETKTDDVPQSKLPSPDLERIKQELKEKEKVDGSPGLVVQEMKRNHGGDSEKNKESFMTSPSRSY